MLIHKFWFRRRSRFGKPENAIYAIVTRLEWEWVISAEVLAEYREVLNRPKLKLSNEKKQRWLNLMETATVNFEVAIEVDFPRDPKDEKFLALAIASGAEVMVTGDRDFEDLEALLPATIIVSPSEFMELAD